MNKLAQNLQKLRIAKKKTQAEICGSLGFKRNTWSNWETGKAEPDIANILIIAHYFGVYAGDLISKDIDVDKLNLEVTQLNKGAKKLHLTEVNTEIYTEINDQNSRNSYMVSEPGTAYGSPANEANPLRIVVETLQARIDTQQASIQFLESTINSLQQALSRAYADIDALKKGR